METKPLAHTRARSGGQGRQEARQRRKLAMVGRFEGKHFPREYKGGYCGQGKAGMRRDFHHQVGGGARAALRHMRSPLLNSPFANRLFLVLAALVFAERAEVE
jgi:hypothetical protein